MAPTESVCLNSTPCLRCTRPTHVDLRSARSSRSWCLGHHTPLDHCSTHSTWPLSADGQCRTRCCTRTSHTTACSSAVCGTRHRHAGEAPDSASSPAATYTATNMPTSPHRRPRRVDDSGLILAHRQHHRQHPRIRSRTHPQPDRTHDRHTRTVLLHTPCRMRRFRCPLSSSHHSTYTTTLSFI